MPNERGRRTLRVSAVLVLSFMRTGATIPASVCKRGLPKDAQVEDARFDLANDWIELTLTSAFWKDNGAERIVVPEYVAQ